MLQMSMNVMCLQVMVPGKQNYSLTLAWHMAYDPVTAVNHDLRSIPEEDGELATVLCLAVS